MMPKISIIIPVYNVEKYLKCCVDSVLSQSFTDFECILVNDGSPDNCPIICDEYTKRDDRIKVIHKKNGGVSSARNSGIDIAQGEWIIFVDSDDWVDNKFLEFLYNNAINNDVEVSICGIKSYTDGVTRKITKDTKNNILTSREARLKLFEEKYYKGFSYNKLIKRKIIEVNNLRYDENVKYMEDVLFFYNLFKYVNKIYYSADPYYFYRQTNDSVTNQIGFTKASISAIYMLTNLYKEEIDNELKKTIFFSKIGFLCNKCIKCNLYNIKNDEFFIQIKYLRKYILSPKLPFILNCKIILLIYLNRLIPFCFFCYKNLKRIINK